MTIAERIQLHRLGYTKEEINELSKSNYDPAGLEDPPKDPEPAPDPEIPADPAAPEQPDNTAVLAAPEQPDNTAVLAAIKNLTAAIQANAIKNTPQPEQPAAESADDILFNILK